MSDVFPTLFAHKQDQLESVQVETYDAPSQEYVPAITENDDLEKSGDRSQCCESSPGGCSE